MRRGRSYWLLLTVSSTLLSACSSSPEKQLQEIRRELASWDSTAQLTRELDRRGAIPKVYVRQVSKAVEEGKQQAQQRAAKLGQ